jgi:hypothetical protein
MAVGFLAACAGIDRGGGWDYGRYLEQVIICVDLWLTTMGIPLWSVADRVGSSPSGFRLLRGDDRGC